MDILKEYPLIDEHGKRYREFGRGCREYAHLTCSDSCMMYKDGRCTIFAAGRKKK